MLVDDPVGGRPGHPEQRGTLAPGPALAHRVRTFTPQSADQLAELALASPANGAIQEGSDAVITPDTGSSSHP